MKLQRPNPDSSQVALGRVRSQQTQSNEGVNKQKKTSVFQDRWEARHVPNIDPGPAYCSLEKADRVLPSAKEALKDPLFPTREPTEIPIDPKILSALLEAKNILVVGHVAPDGDCVGSVKALTNALQAMGKNAHGCVDDQLPGKLRKMNGDNTVKNYQETPQEDYDVVVLLDVAQMDRIGQAKDALKNAKHVLILDHHMVAPEPQDFDLRPDQKLTSQVELGAESASFLVAAAVGHLEEKSGIKLSNDIWKSVALACGAAGFTDTSGFQRPGTALGALSLFKHLVNKKLDGNPDPVLNQLNYQIPLKARLDLEKFAPIRSKTYGGGRVKLATYRGDAFQRSLELSRTKDPDANVHDVRGYIMDRLDKSSQKSEMAVAIIQEDNSPNVRVSVRSLDPKDAPALAEHLGGGGKFGSGAARIATDDLKGLTKKIEAWLDIWGASKQAQLGAR